MSERTLGEFGIMFSAHEKRDEERFQENKEALKEALSDVSDAIQLSSQAIMDEVKEMRKEFGSRFVSLEGKVEILEQARASTSGANRVLIWVAGSFIGAFVAYFGWISIQVIDMKADVQSLQEILSSYNITKQ